MTGIGHNNPPPDAYPDRDGFIVVARSMRDHPVVGFGIKGPYMPAEAWLDLLMECKYREGRVLNGGKVMVIQPGQLVGAVSWLANRWDWTPKQVRLFLDRLEFEGMITKGHADEENRDIGATPQNSVTEKDNKKDKQKGKQAHFITICNYAIYQFVQEKRGQLKGQVERQSEGQMSGNSGANEGQQYKEEQRNKGIQEQQEREEGAFALGADAPAALPMTVEALSAFQAYNELAQRIGLPLARTLTPQRRKSLCARLRENGVESWPIALANIERSAFLRGRNDRNWRCDFDFLMQASKYAKVVDGTYGNGAHGDTLKNSTETQSERMARLMREMSEGGNL